MILQSFHLVSRAVRYQFIDSQALSSSAQQQLIQQGVQAQLNTMQDDAKCVALGINEVGVVNNFYFGVYDPDDVLTGVFFVAALDYQSGPWADLVDWQVTNPNASAIFHARPMPGFPFLSLEDGLDLSVDGAHHMLSRKIQTVDGFDVEFKRFSWAIFKDRSDPNSVAMKRIHDHAKSDNRFAMTELPDPADPNRTRVDIEVA